MVFLGGAVLANIVSARLGSGAALTAADGGQAQHVGHEAGVGRAGAGAGVGEAGGEVNWGRTAAMPGACWWRLLALR